MTRRGGARRGRARTGTAINPRTPLAPGRGIDMFWKTKMCKFHILGACTRGDSCAYAHSKEQLGPLPDLFRTKICRRLIKTGECSDPECRFAHSRNELRAAQLPDGTQLTDECFDDSSGPIPVGPVARGVQQQQANLPFCSPSFHLRVSSSSGQDTTASTGDELFDASQSPSSGGTSVAGTRFMATSETGSQASGQATQVVQWFGDEAEASDDDSDTAHYQYQSDQEPTSPMGALWSDTGGPLSDLMSSGLVTVKNTFLVFESRETQKATQLKHVQTADGCLHQLAQCSMEG